MVKKILITGGNGYIGTRLCIYLAEQGYRVTPICFPAVPQNSEWVQKMDKVVVGDIRDEIFLSGLAENEYDVIVHLVSLDHHQSTGTPSLVSSVNITPTWSLLNIFEKKGLKKFIYFSTIQVYALLPSLNITEQYIPKPTNAYALTHLIGEQICDYYNRTMDIDCRVVCLSNSYGTPVFVENNCWGLVVNDLCKMAYTDQKIILQSDGTPLRDFIHGWDVCRAVKEIIETSAKHFRYHISSGKTLTILEIAEKIQQIYQIRYKKEIEISSLKQLDKTPFCEKYIIDNSLLKSIGFQAIWSLERGINDLFDFLEQNNGR